MRRFRRDSKRGRICVSVAERTPGECLASVRQAGRVAGLVEIRLDYLKGVRLETVAGRRGNGIIVTLRKRGEGGRFEGDEKKRLAVLRRAAGIGADFMDIELSSSPSILAEFLGPSGKTGIVLSCHDQKRTPSLSELRNLFQRMAALAPEVVKIVPFARSMADNLRVLSLLQYARERKQKAVAFCMGEKGRMSRICAPLMGAEWTYAAFSARKATAPGQLTAAELIRTWEMLG